MHLHQSIAIRERQAFEDAARRFRHSFRWCLARSRTILSNCSRHVVGRPLILLELRQERDNILLTLFREKGVLEDTTVTDQEIEAYYNENIEPEDIATILDNKVLDSEGRTILVRFGNLFVCC